MSQDPFKKFKTKKKNSVVKEKFRQEKKSARRDKNAYFDNLKKEEYAARMAKRTGIPAAPKPVAESVTDKKKPTVTTDVVMPLNKFLAHCGVASRRETVDIIEKGNVKVNGETATEPGYKVNPTDEVLYNGKRLYITKNLVYILLNKPKDFITTTDDPQGRKTVQHLIQNATTERVYPIGRLDRNTSGVLLFTNDGDLTQKLSHPSYGVKKIYEVKLDKPLTKAHFEQILQGITLEDGLVQVDSLAFADSKDPSIIGIEIHSGRNRIVRRIFEHLQYDVKGLDRVMYAGLTKKNVERSKWRFLSDKEIRVLKYLNASKGKKAADNAEADALEDLSAKPKQKALPKKTFFKKPAANKDAVTDKKPVADKKPFADRKPLADKKLLVARKPAGDKRPAADKQTSTRKKHFEKDAAPKAKSYKENKEALKKSGADKKFTASHKTDAADVRAVKRSAEPGERSTRKNPGKPTTKTGTTTKPTTRFGKK